MILTNKNKRIFILLHFYLKWHFMDDPQYHLLL